MKIIPIIYKLIEKQGWLLISDNNKKDYRYQIAERVNLPDDSWVAGFPGKANGFVKAVIPKEFQEERGESESEGEEDGRESDSLFGDVGEPNKTSHGSLVR